MSALMNTGVHAWFDPAINTTDSLTDLDDVAHDYAAALNAMDTFEARAEKDNDVEIALDHLAAGDRPIDVLDDLYQQAFIRGFMANAVTARAQLWHARLESKTLAGLLEAEKPVKVRARRG